MPDKREVGTLTLPDIRRELEATAADAQETFGALDSPNASR